MEWYHILAYFTYAFKGTIQLFQEHLFPLRVDPILEGV